jgi:hypothetical protein
VAAGGGRQIGRRPCRPAVLVKSLRCTPRQATGQAPGRLSPGPALDPDGGGGALRPGPGAGFPGPRRGLYGCSVTIQAIGPTLVLTDLFR